ncbi:hypothetical protein PTKIN_Ptkin08bG0067500 [Pterospermum kingtungense]
MLLKFSLRQPHILSFFTLFLLHSFSSDLSSLSSFSLSLSCMLDPSSLHKKKILRNVRIAVFFFFFFFGLSLIISPNPNLGSAMAADFPFSFVPPFFFLSVFFVSSVLFVLMATRYRVVSLLVRTSTSTLWATLQEQISIHSFNTPLYRSNSFIEGVFYKIKRQIEELDRVSGLETDALVHR